MCSVIGLGFVGSALLESFHLKNIQPIRGYDKYKNGGIGSFDDCLETPIVFICLPTPFDEVLMRYGKESIDETMKKLEESRYTGSVVLKSTVEPGTSEGYEKRFPTLNLCHNPEFLSAATAFNDFHNQKHIVLGRGRQCGDLQFDNVKKFYEHNYPQAEISICSSGESESMKSFVNSFYAVKIQFFNELYTLCQQNDVNYNHVKDLMLKNGWINPMHTSVPGRDGKLSYGGGCFPKDTNALLQQMKRKGTPHAVLEGCIRERNLMRSEEHISNGTIINGHKKAEKITNGFCNGGLENGHTYNTIENGHIMDRREKVENGLIMNGYDTVANGHVTNDLDKQMNGHIMHGCEALENKHIISDREAFR